MSRGKGTHTQKARIAEGNPPRCEWYPRGASRCKEYATTIRYVDGIEFDLCRVHAEGVDLQERRRRLAAQ